MASRVLRRAAAVASLRIRLAEDGWRMFDDENRIHTCVEILAGAPAARQPAPADDRADATKDEGESG